MQGNAWTIMPFDKAVQINPSVPLQRGVLYPFVDMRIIVPNLRSVGYSEMREFKGGGSRFMNSDTIMARITPCLENGKIARFAAPLDQPLGHGSTEFIVIRGRPNVTDNMFAYYLAKWGIVWQYCISQMTGSSGRQRVPASALGNFKIPIPPLKEQQAIAHILGTLDDKIELNLQMNQTLEAMARAIFKSWFVDFDPVRAKMNSPSPDGRGVRGEGIRPATHTNTPIPTDILDFARQMRRQATDAEALLWRLLRGRRIANAKFRRQHFFPPYILDFYCYELKLAVELDGGQHNLEDDRRRDARRDAYLAEHGIRVLRFWNNDVLRETEAVLEAIYAAVVERVNAVPSPPAPLPGGEGSYPQHILDLFPDRLMNSELGEIPKGWKVARLTDEFNLTMGQSPPGSTYNESGQGVPFFQGTKDFGYRFPEKRVYCTAPTRFAHAGNTLVSVRAPVGNLNMASEKCCIGRGLAALRHCSNSRSYTYYAMHFAKELFLVFDAEGTVFGSISKKDFESISFIVPPNEIVSMFELIVFPIDERILTNEREIKVLAALRDALLPKLISGELPFPDAERIVGRCV